MERILKGLAVLGSTGSVGTQTLDVVRQFPEQFRVVGLAARRSLDLLGKQVKEFKPKLISCQGTEDELAILRENGCDDCNMVDMACHPEVDLVVTATVGDVALPATFSAIRAGKDIALANKETVVTAGEKVTSLAKEYGVSLLPLDSEPNAIWQCLRGESDKISRLIITASGGAFRGTSMSDLQNVTADQALKHPTWAMGRKITIDSATMMNKAFEVIEAKWLFDVDWDDIEVVIHPESYIHSMVEFVDGSVKAQISPPDMHLPIQYALFYPDRVYNESISRFDPVALGGLTFLPWDDEKYKCFHTALEFAKKGGTYPAVLSGADDSAVDAFLDGKIGFFDIEKVIRQALVEHHNIEDPSLDDISNAAQWARNRVLSIVED